MKYVVCRAKEGDIVKAGDRFGVMKFGSRMDLFLPASAMLTVKPGDRVIGGVTVIALLAPAEDQASREHVAYAARPALSPMPMSLTRWCASSGRRRST